MEVCANSQLRGHSDTISLVVLQPWYFAAKLQKGLAGAKTSPDFPLAWGEKIMNFHFILFLFVTLTSKPKITLHHTLFRIS